MHRNPTHLNRGFTLIELMITLAVLAIILGLAIPSFTDQIRNNRSLTFGEEFATALNYTRSEAIKRGDLVTLCASNDAGTACGDDWTNGWLTIVDGAASEVTNSVTVGEVLRYWNAANDDMSLVVERDGSNFDFVRFIGSGALASVGGNDDSIDVTAKHDDCTGNSARAMRVGASGAVQLRRIDC